MNRDLTVGRPGAVLWRFCLPLFGSVVFQQLYSIADSFVAGRFIGEGALASVGNSYEITLIFLAFAFGCNIGCSVVTSELFGAKKYADMKTAVYTALISVGALCALLMAAGLIFSGGLLRLINTPEELFADSGLYLDIYIFGLPFMFFYNTSNGIFTALGDSKTPFFFLAASSTANIGLDILFVKAFRMGVAGVAWATFICQGISCLLALFFVFRRLRSVKAEEKARAFSWPLLGRLAKIAIPSIIQQSFISVGNITVQGVINTFQKSVMAGYSSAIKLNGIALTTFNTLGNGISNYTAQNLGAGKPERIKKGFRAGVLIGWALCIPMMIAFFFFGKGLVTAFLKEPSEAAVRTGTEFLRIVSPFYFTIALKIAADGILRGVGMMKKFLAVTLIDFTLRVVLVITLAKPLGSSGIWWAWPAGWIVAVALSVIFYRGIKWHALSPEGTEES
ncbi:MAG: MATE family efflux transporter [Oscillospiraceae bacterium]|nr:MATE family efflux transporter [Oscillospiraceae bacterium]